MKLKSFLPRFKDPKIIGLIGFIIILFIGIPFAVFLNQTPTKIRQNAAFTGDQFDTCGNIKITFTEVPLACETSANQPGMNTHSSQIIATLIKTLGSGNSITLDWNAISYWCPTSASLSGSSCLLNPVSNHGVCTVSDSNTTCTFSLNPRSPVPPYAGLSCGLYQDDYAFNYQSGSYGGTGCHWGSYNFQSDNSPGGALYCHAGDCIIPSLTPINTPTITPFDSLTPTPIPTIISNTPTPSLIPTTTLTPQPSNTPTPGNTVTPGPSNTPTPQPSNTPTPGPSSTPGTTIIIQNITNTPAPTVLPATGPSNNTVINFGIIGGIISILGAAILFGL